MAREAVELGPDRDGRAGHPGLAGAAGLIVVAIGGAAALGWLTGQLGLAAWGQGAAVKPLSAVCLLTLGVGLLIRTSHLIVRRRIGMGVAAVAALSLIDKLLGIGVGLERWLLPSPTAPDAVAALRMLPTTAIALMLAGASLALECPARHRATFAAVAAAIGAIALISLAGAVSGVSPFNTVPLPTAAALLALAAGLVAQTGLPAFEQAPALASVQRLVATQAHRTRPLSRWLLLMSLGIALPLIVLAGILAFSYAARERAHIEHDAIALVSVLTDAVDRELSGLMATINVLAATPYLQDDRLGEFDALARAVAPRIGANIVVRDRSHQQVVNTRLPRGAQLPVNTDTEGDRRVLASRQTEISDVFIGGVTRTPLVMINAPVIKDGEVRYFVNPSIPPERIRDVLLAQNIPEGWNVTVSDRKGMIVARSRGHENFVGRSAAAGLLDMAAKQPHGLWRGVNLEGVEVAVAFKRSPLSGWLIGGGVPVAQLNAPLRQALWTFAAVALALMLLSVAVASIMGRWLSRSVTALADAGDALTANTPIAPLSSPIEEVASVHRTLDAALARRQENEMRLRLFVEHAPASIAMLDRDMRYVAASRRWREDFRLDIDPTGRSHYEIFPEIPERWREVHRRALAGEVLSAEEDPFERADGSIQYVRWECRPWHSAEGEVAGILIGTEEETSRVLARQETTRLAAIVTSTADAVVSKTLAGKITSWNAAAERLFGYSSEEMVGQSIRRLFPLERLAEEDMILDRISAAETVERYETVRLTKDGRPVDVAVTVSPVRDAQGRVAGASTIIRDITERKRTERALSESEQTARTQAAELASIYDSARIGLCVLDRDLRFVRINERLAVINGVPEAEHIGRTVREVVPDIAETVERLAAEIFRTGEPVLDFEISGMTPAQPGVLRWWLEQWAPLKDDSGAVIGINIVAEEVTERKQVEAALRESESRLAAALRAGRLGVYDYDPRTGRAKCDALLHKLWGVPEAAPFGIETFEAGIHPDDIERVRQAVADALNPEGSGRFEAEYRVVSLDDDTLRWVKSEGDTTFDGDKAVRLVGIAQDITEQKEAARQAQELAATRQRLAAIVESTIDAVIGFDVDGRITDWNGAAERLFGYSAAEAIGRGADLLVAPLGSPPAGETERGAFDVALAGKRFERDTRRVAKDGTVIDVSVTASQVRTPDGQIIGVSATMRDIRERKRAEEQLRQRNQQLDLLAKAAQTLLEVPDDEPRVLSAIFGQIADLLGVESFYHYQPSTEPRLLELATAHGIGEQERHLFGTMRYGELLCGRVAERQTRLVIEDLQHCDAPGSEVLRGAGATSYAGFPIVADGRLIGTVAFVSRRLTHFRDVEIQTIQTVCDHIATAVERARLQRQLVQSESRLAVEVEDLRRLHTLSLRLAETADVRTVLEQTLHTAAELVAVGTGSVQVLEPDRKLSLVALLGFDETIAARFATVEEGDVTTCVTAMRQKQRVVVEDLARDPVYRRFVEDVAPHKVRGAASTPLLDSAGEILAMFTVYWSEPHRPTDRELQLLDLCAGIAGRHLERKQAEERVAEYARSLTQERARLDLALRTGHFGVYEWRPSHDQLWWSPETYEVFGVEPGVFTPTIESFTSLVHPDDRAELWRKSDETIASRSLFEHEFRIVRPDGAQRWIMNRSFITVNAEGEVDRVTGVAADITERKQREEQVFLLMKEVNHRAKNMLGLVQSIARQTASTDPKDFVKRFGERIQALSANQDLLVNNSWMGVGSHELVAAQLAPFKDLIGTRISVDGPPLRFTPAAAQALGLALHELATNAGKYGALSNERGCVRISWGRSNEKLRFEWKESDGPPVSPPQRKGFGTTVLDSLSRMSLYGEVEADYAPDGFRWRLCCPVEKALDGGNHEQKLSQAAVKG